MSSGSVGRDGDVRRGGSAARARRSRYRWMSGCTDSARRWWFVCSGDVLSQLALLRLVGLSFLLFFLILIPCFLLMDYKSFGHEETEVG